MHFSKTLPVDMPTPLLLVDVVEASGYGEASTARAPSTLDPSTLSPSLRSDLKCFDQEALDGELLRLVAASVRHLRPMTLHVVHGETMLALSVFPREQQFHCSVDVCALPAHATAGLRLVHVGPAFAGEAPEPAHAGHAGIGNLGPLLWRLAMHGSRGELLPEIAGPVRYRLAPGVPLRALPLEPWTAPMLTRLRRQASTIEELAPFTQAARARARRLLNAVYLQGRLMITRSLPAGCRAATVRWSIN